MIELGGVPEFIWPLRQKRSDGQVNDNGESQRKSKGLSKDSQRFLTQGANLVVVSDFLFAIVEVAPTARREGNSCLLSCL